MEHLLQGFNGVDAPACARVFTYSDREQLASSDKQGVLTAVFCASPLKNLQWRQYVFSRPAVRPLTRISNDATSEYLSEEFQRNLAEIFLMWVDC